MDQTTFYDLHDIATRTEKDIYKKGAICDECIFQYNFGCEEYRGWLRVWNEDTTYDVDITGCNAFMEEFN